MQKDIARLCLSFNLRKRPNPIRNDRTQHSGIQWGRVIGNGYHTLFCYVVNFNGTDSDVIGGDSQVVRFNGKCGDA